MRHGSVAGGDASGPIARWMASELFEQVPMSICVIEPSLRISAYNTNFFAVFGDPEGKPCHVAYKKKATVCETCSLQKTFRDGVSRISEEWGEDCIGNRADYMVHHSPVYDDSGRIAFVVNMSYDITDRKSFQTQYNLLFDRVPCTLSVINRDLRIVRANEQGRLMFGQAVGSHCYRAYKHNDGPCRECPAQQTFGDGKVHSSREGRLTSRGEHTYHIVSTAPLATDRQGVSHVVEMSLDVTEVHELSAELEQQRAIRHDITESSLDALVAVDERDVVTIYNAAAESLFGYARSAVVQQPVAGKLLPEAFREAIRSGQRSLLLPETRVVTSIGEEIPVRLSGTVLRSADRVVGGAAFLQDLRAIKELQRNTLRNERMAAVGLTVTQLAHGIKNILTGLQGGIYDIKKGSRGGDVARREEGLETLDRNFARIHSMVRDFLRLSKDHELQIEPNDPNQVVREVHELFRPWAEKCGIELVLELGAVDRAVCFDREAVHTCLANLVSNAMEACGQLDGDPCRVRISTATRDDTLQFQVEDTGCGMDKETQEKLFHNIFTTKGASGTGLGLMITKKIVEDHGGKLRVVSRKGGGSVFTMELPNHRGQPRLADGATAGGISCR